MQIKFKKTKSDGIKAFAGKVWGDFFKSKGLKQEDDLLVYLIYLGDKKIGYAEIYLLGKVAYLREFIILGRFRGKGIGQAALSEIEAIAIKKGCRKIRLETSKELMPEAFRLYKKSGFSIEAKLRNDYFNKDWVILSKYLGINAKK